MSSGWFRALIKLQEGVFNKAFYDCGGAVCTNDGLKLVVVVFVGLGKSVSHPLVYFLSSLVCCRPNNTSEGCRCLKSIVIIVN